MSQAAPRKCPRCGAARRWKADRKGRWAYCHGCAMADQRARRSPSLGEAVAKLLDFGVPMTGNYRLGVVCGFCGQTVEQLQADGHTADCVWAGLKAAFLRAGAAVEPAP